MPRSRPLPAPRTLLPGNPDWPAGLDALERPPRSLRLAGTLPELEGAVSIVGTRYADEEALDWARRCATELAAAGRCVVSGGAWGIDAAAHQGALDGGGATVVVMPTGFDRIYPARHRPLFERVLAAGGALLTEQPDGVPPARWTFLARNRLVAALGSATVVVQAPARSGALSTARVGFSLEKEVFSVPHAPWDVRGEGCLELLRRGARVCTCARDILSVRPPGLGEISGKVPPDKEKRNVFEGLDADSQLLLGLVSRQARHPDELVQRTGLSVSRIQRALLQLQLRGLLRHRTDGTYATKPPTGHR